jgi:RHS repeat-associated protein
MNSRYCFIHAMRSAKVRSATASSLIIALLLTLFTVQAHVVRRVTSTEADADWFDSLLPSLSFGSTQDEEAYVAADEDPTARVTHLELCPKRLLLYVGETYTLVPVAYGQSNEPVSGANFVWTADDATVADVTSWGEVNAIAPGKAHVWVQVGHTRTKVSVDVREGARPVQSDAEYDIEHALDCEEPEAALETVERDALGLRDSRQDAVASLREMLGFASAEPEPEPRPVRRVAARTSAAKLPGFSGYAFFDGGANEDPPARQAISAENAVGSPRFGAVTPAEGSSIGASDGHGNNNFTFTAPVLSLGGREAGVSLALAYNSRVWERDTDPAGATTMRFNYTKGWPAAGWRLGYGRILANYDDTDSGNGSGSGTGNAPGNFLLVQADGTRVHLEQYYDGAAGIYKHESSDGSFLRFNPVNGKLKYPDGTVVTYEVHGGRRLPGSIQSPNGNIIKIGYRTYVAGTFPVRWAINTIEDTLGRVITFNYAGDSGFPVTTATPQASLVSITTTGYGGTPRTLVAFEYADSKLDWSFDSISVSNVEAPVAKGQTITVLRRIYYPATGTGYVFNPYVSDSNRGDYSTYGMIRRVSMRSGMSGASGTPGDGDEVASSRYDYPANTTESGTLGGAPRYNHRYEWWEGKTDEAGIATSAETDYHYEQSSASGIKSYRVTYQAAVTGGASVASANKLVMVTEVVDDSNSPSNGKLNATKLYKNSEAAGNLLRKVAYGYVNPAGDELQVQTVTTTIDEGAQLGIRSQVEFTYGAYGRIDLVKEYDFHNGTSYPLVRTTDYDYLDTKGTTSYVDTSQNYGNFLRLVTSVKVKEGSTVKARTDFAYDDYASITSYGTGLPPATTRNSVFDNTTTTLRGNVTSTTEYVSPATGGTTIVRGIKYDVYGNVVEADVSCCRQKYFTFTGGTTGLYYSAATTVIDGTGSPSLSTNLSYDFNTGLVKTVTDANSQQTTYDYSSSTWRLSRITAPTGAYTDFAYDDEDRIYGSTLTYTESGVTKKVSSTTWLDGAGHTLRAGTRSESPVGNFDVVAVKYDALGRAMWQSNPYTTSAADGTTGGTIYWTKTTFDPLSRVTKVTLPDGQTVQTDYSQGKTVKVTDQVSRSRQQTVDGLGRVVTVAEQDPATGSLTWTTTSTYDVLGNVTQINQGGQLRSFKYDGLSRLLYDRTPEQDATILEPGTSTYWSGAYTYTDFGAIDTYKDSRGTLTDYNYDTLNRPDTVTYTEVGGATATSNVDVGYHLSDDGVGQVSTITQDGGGGTESFLYDAFGRLTTRTWSIDGRSWQTSYEYNTAGQLTAITYPSGKKVQQKHDDRGRLKELNRINGTTLSYAKDLVYDAAGNVTNLTLGNGIAEEFDFTDDRLQLRQQKAVKGPKTLLDLTYGYSAAAGKSGYGTLAGNSGQLMSVTGTVNGITQNQAFEYDNVGRLVKSTGPGSAAAGQGNDTIGTYHPGSATFNLRNSNSSGPADLAFTFGSAGWTPLAGNWDGLGADTIGAYDPASSTFYLKNANSGGAADVVVQFGAAGTTYIPIVGDWDGDGDDTIGLYYPPTGAFFLRNSNTGADLPAFSFGPGGGDWTPVSGDWDNDGDDSVGVYSESNNRLWYLRNDNTAGVADLSLGFGPTGSQPIAGDWNGDGTATIGVYLPASGTSPSGSFFLRDENSPGNAHYVFQFGGQNQKAIAGNWDGAPSGAGGSRDRRYEYDRWGNRERVYNATTGGTLLQTATFARSGSVPTTNRITSVIDGMTAQTFTYSYDANGNLTDDYIHDYTYDGASRLSSVVDGGTTTASYVYDAANRRVKKSESGATTYYVWEGGQVIAEYDGTGALQVEYIYLGARLVAKEAYGAVTYYHSDQLSTRLSTNDVGSYLGMQSHLPFGEPADASGGVEKHRFTNYDRDDATGTDYAINRQFGSDVGRFMRPDPIPGNVANPQGLNRYAYSLNDPINLVDPLGLWPGTVRWGEWIVVPDVVGRTSEGDWIIGWVDYFVDWQLSGQSAPSPRGNVPQSKKVGDPECDAIIAWLFGGRGAVVTTEVDVSGLDRSGHLRNRGVFHIYFDPNAGGQSNLYVPAGATWTGYADPENPDDPEVQKRDNMEVREYNQANYSWEGYTIGVMHLANPTGGNGTPSRSDLNSAGSMRIGDIGGPGGEWDHPIFNIHSHILIRKDGKPVDPRKAFCNSAMRARYRRFASGRR